MAQSKLTADYNLPILAEKYDRFCTNCDKVIEHLALEKYPKQKCPWCNVEVEFLDSSDGLYRRCVRCISMLRCTMQFCYLCGRQNPFFDPLKPARLEKATKCRLREEVERDHEKKRAKTEAESLSKSCLDDGDFETVTPDDVKTNWDPLDSGSGSSSNKEKTEGTMELVSDSH